VLIGTNANGTRAFVFWMSNTGDDRPLAMSTRTAAAATCEPSDRESDRATGLSTVARE
jgi:hypothetical protein